MRNSGRTKRSRARSLQLAAGCLALTALSPTATAQDSTSLEDMIVTATRVARSPDTVPANVTVITAADIARTTAQNVPDVLKYAAGLQVADMTGSGRQSIVDIRGFGDETATFNTLVLVDGRRMNGPDMSNVDWSTIPLERIERIEIVRGGGSVQYGNNAVGGVINIITKKGADRPVLQSETVVESYGGFRQSLGLSGAAGPWRYSITGSYRDSDGYRENSYFRNASEGLRLAYDADGAVALDLSAGVKRDRYGLPAGLPEAQDRREVLINSGLRSQCPRRLDLIRLLARDHPAEVDAVASHVIQPASA